jgi:hypothetical protein
MIMDRKAIIWATIRGQEYSWSFDPDSTRDLMEITTLIVRTANSGHTGLRRSDVPEIIEAVRFITDRSGD